MWNGERLQERSHGESFLTVLKYRFADVGVYFLDEPEAALSFQSCLGLMSLLHQMRREGSQVIVATHSPLLVSLPEATLLEVGDWGIRRVDAPDDLRARPQLARFPGCAASISPLPVGGLTDRTLLLAIRRPYPARRSRMCPVFSPPSTKSFPDTLSRVFRKSFPVS
jgi:hypothetical protein